MRLQNASSLRRCRWCGAENQDVYIGKSNTYPPQQRMEVRCACGLRTNYRRNWIEAGYETDSNGRFLRETEHDRIKGEQA